MQNPIGDLRGERTSMHYEPPTLTVHGTVEAWTTGTQGGQTDAPCGAQGTTPSFQCVKTT